MDNNAGTIASNGATSVAAGSLTNQSGTVRAAGASDLNLRVAGALDNSAKGEIGASGNANVAAGRIDNSTGRVTAAGDLAAHADGALINASGTLAANGRTDLNAGTLGQPQRHRRGGEGRPRRHDAGRDRQRCWISAGSRQGLRCAPAI